MKCEFCGDSCTLCSQQYGCVQDFKVGQGLYFRGAEQYPASRSLYSALAPSEKFATTQTCTDPRCSSCGTLNSSVVPGSSYLQCNACFQYVNFYFEAKLALLTCLLCNSDIPNCLQCDSDKPATCLSCKDGYYIDKVANTCNSCGMAACKRCSQTACLECNKGYILSPSGKCDVQCDLSVFNQGYFAHQQRCTQCKASDKTACQYCDNGFLNSRRSPDTCELTCDDGQFPNGVYTLINYNYVLTETTCDSCDSSCLTCAGSLPTQCLSCQASSYLEILSIPAQIGSCRPRIPFAQSTPLKIYVTNVIPANPQSVLLSADIGSYSNPAFDFLFALKIAKDQASKYSNGSIVPVNIYLTKGSHYAIRDRGDTNLQFQHTSLKGVENLNYALTVSPIACSQNLENVQSVCTDGQVTIYNKQKEIFEIEVPANLTLDSVIIDSLDSILYDTLEPCLDLRQNCCQITNNVVNTIPNAATAGVCEKAILTFEYSFESSCSINRARTMFKMALNSNGDLSKPNNLTITGSEIKNIYYAMNSLISLTPIQGVVLLKDSKFSKLSLCGGIVKNKFTEPTIPQVQTHTNLVTFTNLQKESIVQRQLLESSAAPQSPNYVPPGVKCSAAECFSIIIDSSQFTEIPSKLAPTSNLKLVSQANGLQLQGLVLNLDGFSGPVSITGSTFEKNKLPLNTCGVSTPQTTPSLNNFNQLSNPLTDFDKVQLTSLISIQNSAKFISISHNTFADNVMTAGLIRIGSSGVTNITANTFTQNAAAFQTNIMTLRQCTGLSLKQNTFNNNIGCQDAGGIRIQCVSSAGFTYTAQTDQYSIKDAAAPTPSSAVDLESNLYKGNFIGNQNQFLSIEGFQNVTLTSELFNQNENFLPQAFIRFSPMQSQLSNQAEFKTITTLEGYKVRAQAVLRIASSTRVTLAGVSFDSNWVLDEYSQYSEFQSILLIQDLVGSLSVTNTQWLNHRGSGNSFVANIISSGIQSSLLLLKDAKISSLVFSQVTFASNQGISGPQDLGQVTPLLFKLEQSQFASTVTEVTLSQLTLRSNMWTNADSIVIFKLENLVLDAPSIIVNQVDGSVIRLEYLHSTSVVKVQSGIITSNTAGTGSVIYATEAIEGNFIQQFTFSEPQYLNLHILGTQFSLNTGSEMSSCVTVAKHLTSYSYSWMSLLFQNVEFSENSGGLTNDIYFADSMVMNVVIDGSIWNIPISDLVTSKLAQVIYKNDVSSFLKISNSVFSCSGQSYSNDVVMQFQKTKTQGRAGLFRISDSSGLEVQLILNPYPNEQFSQSNGTLNATFFRNQFITNQYKNCNNVRRGAIYYLENGARVSEMNSSYTDNSALEGGIAYLKGDGTYLKISSLQYPYIQKTFAYYGALFFATDGATAHISSVPKIHTNSAFEGVIAYLENRARLILKDCSEVKNNKVRKRGLINGLTGSQFWVEDVVFTGNTAAYDSAVVFSEGCRELYSLVNGDTPSQYGKSNILVSFLINVSIELPIATYGRLISLIDSRMFLNNVTFTQIDSIFDVNYGIYVFDGDLKVARSNFQGPILESWFTQVYQKKLKNINGAFISLFGQSTLSLESSNLNGGRGTLGGCIAIMGASNSTITNTTFTQCAAMQGGAIYAVGFVSLNLKTSIFENNIAYQGYGQNIYAYGVMNSMSIENSNFTSYHNSLYFKGQSLSVKHSTFRSDNRTQSVVAGLNTRSYGAGLYIYDTFQVDVTNTYFVNLVGIKGGAVFISETPNSQLSLEQFLGKTAFYGVSFKENTIVNCNASEDGGGFYVENTQNAVISTLTTITGKAKGRGGGVAFYCTPDPKLECGLQLSNVLFDSCKAEVGGAIYWNFIEPSMDTKKARAQLQFGAKNKTTYGSLAFTNCDASIYGRQISGVPQEIVEIEYHQFITYYYRLDKDKASMPLKLETLQFFFRKTFKDVSSGSLIPDSYFAVIDKYGQVVSNSLGAKLHYTMLAQPVGETSEFETEITGFKDFFSMFGVFNMTGMGILSEPAITIPGVLTFKGIDNTIPSVNAFLSQKYQKPIDSNWQYNITINMLVRGCVVGEGLKADGACFVCPKGTYLLEIPTTATECEVCSVEKSICLGGADIGPKRGYWRKSIKSYNFISCYEEVSCIGLQEDLIKPPNHPSDYQKVGLCNSTFGYYGALCSGCLPGFKRVGNFQCSVCGEHEIYIQIGGLAAAMAFLLYLVYSTIKGATEDNTSSIYIKIMLNHMQMLLITSSFDLAWPAAVKQIFNIAVPIQQFMNSIFSFDCWMNQIRIEDVDDAYIYNFYAPEDEWRVVYQKLIISALLPVFIAVVAHCTWWVILKIQKKSSELFTKFTATVVLLLFLVHPSITQSMIDMFNCADYDGDFRLLIDLQVICYTGLHKYLAFGVALPCLIVWGIGIPITVFFLMRKESDRLETNAVKQRFGFLYNGYKRQNYYWEIIIMYRKIFCIFIAVFLRRIGIIVQALVLLIVLMMFMQANSSRRPFAARALNDIESFSLITQIVTIYCGLFFVSSKDKKSESFNVNTDFYLDETGKFAFFIVIAVCNVGFVVLWLTKYIQVIRVLIKDKYPRLYVYLFLCGRFDKLLQETAKRAKDSKKEAIIECIEGIVLNMQKMKGLYVDSIFYEDHNRFLKLLYYIEAERLQIDLTEKKHNYYIQGNIQRLRKFDPAIMKERQNLCELDVVTNVNRDNIAIAQQQKTIQESQGMSTSTFLQGMKLLKEKVAVQIQQNPSSRNQDSAKRINAVQPQSMDEENKIGIQTGRSEGLSVVRNQIYNVNDETDLLEIDDDDGFTQMNQSQKKSQKQKQRKKPNVADLTQFFKKTRQNRFTIHAEKKNRIKVGDIGDDGMIMDKSVLPKFLAGFKSGYDVPQSQNSADDKSQDSIHSRLHLMRKLTDREYSPEKTVSLAKKNRDDDEGVTQIDTVQNPSEVTGTTHEAPLKVYKKPTGESEELKETQGEFKIDGAREIVVTKGNGQEKPKPNVSIIEEQGKRQMRPKKGARVEYRDDGMVVEHLAKSTIDPDLEELNGQLQISLLDEDDDLINRKKKRSEKTLENYSKSLKDYEQSVEEDIAEVEKQDSFKTDSSMRDYNLEENELRPQTAQLFVKKSSDRQETIGDGLGVKKKGGQAPLIILNTSESAAGDSNFDESIAQQLDGKDFYQEHKSRNN